MVKAVRSSETSVHLNVTIRCYIPGDSEHLIRDSVYSSNFCIIFIIPTQCSIQAQIDVPSDFRCVEEINLILHSLSHLFKVIALRQSFPVHVVLGSIMVRVLAIWPKVRGFIPSRGRRILKGDKNPQHAFLRRGSKAVGMLKITSKYEYRYFVTLN
jgi:hypothetical protein